ncbi:MAG: arsenate reductase ArsC [Candidatus Syntrophosphaera sp.]|nr:arsenate reductase ArsC [Candidatus Syntrophosphaera sp.]
MKNVLILCTGNSCRSLMAEAMINHFLGSNWMAYSAGTQPSEVNPLARKVLEELGIDTSNLRSKSVTEFLGRDDLDLVITVCDNAKESCPVFPRPVKRIHIGIDDPAPFTDQAENVALPIFRQALEQVRMLVLAYLESYGDNPI